ncbi:MAG: hypothetical protein M1816_003124 [Peltula sp. TS41687]|nr:MAG: hypothetical protein M1816_003124 [Peltula sp. TS41687]
MFCLRSWLPLLFIPTNASPAFILLFFLSTYFLNRPCVYCSVLLFILFLSSCNWSDHCFFDLHSNWFEPRHMSSPLIPGAAIVVPRNNHSTTAAADDATAAAAAAETASFVASALQSSAKVLVTQGAEELKKRLLSGGGGGAGAGIGRSAEWTGVGVSWVRSLLGRREWRLPCLDVHVRL